MYHKYLNFRITAHEITIEFVKAYVEYLLVLEVLHTDLYSSVHPVVSTH